MNRVEIWILRGSHAEVISPKVVMSVETVAPGPFSTTRLKTLNASSLTFADFDSVKANVLLRLASIMNAFGPLNTLTELPRNRRLPRSGLFCATPLTSTCWGPMNFAGSRYLMPIWVPLESSFGVPRSEMYGAPPTNIAEQPARSEEHTSELQSPQDL